MNVKLENAGKRFRKEWVFRNMNMELGSGGTYAICGLNGSGKSTLAQVISGFLTLTEGKVHRGETDTENAFSRISFAAPYLDVPEDFKLEEFLRFHFSIRPLSKTIRHEDVSTILELDQHSAKQVSSFSSGMKQRLKLGLALLQESDLIILDEPCTNLDANGKKWYEEIINKYRNDRTLIVFSNHLEEETSLCGEKLDMEKFKLHV